MNLQSAHYVPAKWKYNKMRRENTLFMGMELEMECNSTSLISNTQTTRENLRYALLDQLEDILIKIRRNNHFYVKEDSSLSNGVELVTHPFTLQYAHSKLKLTELVSYLHSPESGFITSRNTGLHVHLTRKFFTNFELRKLRAFFKINYTPYILNFGQRKSHTSYGRLNDNMSFKKFLTAEDHEITQVGRESCLAIYNNMAPTIEVRLFQSSTNPDRVKAILQFCDAISFFIKEVSLATILQKKVSWETFINWCKSQHRYAQFLQNLKDIENGKYKDPMFHMEA